MVPWPNFRRICNMKCKNGESIECRTDVEQVDENKVWNVGDNRELKLPQSWTFEFVFHDKPIMKLHMLGHPTYQFETRTNFVCDRFGVELMLENKNIATNGHGKVVKSGFNDLTFVWVNTILQMNLKFININFQVVSLLADWEMSGVQQVVNQGHNAKSSGGITTFGRESRFACCKIPKNKTSSLQVDGKSKDKDGIHVVTQRQISTARYLIRMMQIPYWQFGMMQILHLHGNLELHLCAMLSLWSYCFFLVLMLSHEVSLAFHRLGLLDFYIKRL